MNNPISGKGPLTLANSIANPLWGLKVYGRSIQNGTPKPDAPVTIATIPNAINVTVSKSGDPTQTQTLNIPVPVHRKNLCPTNNLTFETSEQIKFAVNIPAGDYVISAMIESTDTDSTTNLALFYYTDGTTKEVYLTRDSGRVYKTFTLTAEATRVRLYASEGHTLSSGDTATWSDIQIEAGSEMTAFEPYITESYGLPGVPVASDGTYTDENSQQWVADEIDFGSGKYIQRIGRIILANDANLQESPYYYGDDTIGAVWHNLIPEDYDTPRGLCEYALVGDYMPGNIDTSLIWVGSVGLDLVFWIDVIRYLGFTTMDEFKTWLGDKKIPVFYKLKEPIEHDLPQELMDAYAALVTYDGGTVVDNDQDAWMDVAYAESGSEDLTKTVELVQYFMAMAGVIPLAICPDPTCRMTHLIRRYLDPDYVLPFIWLGESSHAERYMLDLIYGTTVMLSHIPKSDMEILLHRMIGGVVDELPDPNACELNYWMNEALNKLEDGKRITLDISNGPIDVVAGTGENIGKTVYTQGGVSNVVNANVAVLITGSTETNMITVKGGNSTIILRNVNITVSGPEQPAILLYGGDDEGTELAAKLTVSLEGENIIISTYAPAIQINKNAILTITGSGKLYAETDDNLSPGIGAGHASSSDGGYNYAYIDKDGTIDNHNNYRNMGNLIIKNGEIHATAGGRGTGRYIGGLGTSYYAYFGTITIEGGVLYSLNKDVNGTGLSTTNIIVKSGLIIDQTGGTRGGIYITGSFSMFGGTIDGDAVLRNAGGVVSITGGNIGNYYTDDIEGRILTKLYFSNSDSLPMANTTVYVAENGYMWSAITDEEGVVTTYLDSSTTSLLAGVDPYMLKSIRISDGKGIFKLRS